MQHLFIAETDDFKTSFVQVLCAFCIAERLFSKIMIASINFYYQLLAEANKIGYISINRMLASESVSYSSVA